MAARTTRRLRLRPTRYLQFAVWIMLLLAVTACSSSRIHGTAELYDLPVPEACSSGLKGAEAEPNEASLDVVHFVRLLQRLYTGPDSPTGGGGSFSPGKKGTSHRYRVSLPIKELVQGPEDKNMGLLLIVLLRDQRERVRLSASWALSMKYGCSVSSIDARHE